MSCKESTAVALCAPYLDLVGIAFIEFHPTVKTALELHTAVLVVSVPAVHVCTL